MRSPEGRLISAGMFGVVKTSDDPIEVDGVELPFLRLIFNLIPSSACLDELDGDILDLPSQGQFSSLALMDREVFLLSSRDRQCFFYVWRLGKN